MPADLERCFVFERLKTAFLSNLSHEFRTPLNSLIGHAELLREILSTDDEVRSSIDAIIRASHRMEKNFRTLFDLSKLECGLFPIAPAQVRLFQVISLALFDIRPEAQRKGIALIHEIEDREISVTIDEYCLRQTLANLLDNAVKFTETGQIVVQVSREPDTAACIVVRDTGIGIDPSHVPHLFAPFLQESTGLNRRYQGLGLGLALARRYLELNGANLSVESTKQRGTAFVIRLPITKNPKSEQGGVGFYP